MGEGRLRETGGRGGWALGGGRRFPTPRPRRPCPGNPGLPPRGGTSRPAQASTPRRRRPARGPRGPAGARGGPGEGVGCGRRGARRPRPSRHPHPAPHPHPGPGRPRRSPCSGPGWTPVRPPARRPCPRAPQRPPGSQPPPPRRRPLSPLHPVSGAWRRPANPRSHVSALAARPACAAQPAALREPGDVGRAWGRLCLPFSCFFFFPPSPLFPRLG